MGDITDWNDLDSIRDSNDTTFTLTQDLDSNTAGYDSVASSSANGGSGWNPIDFFDGTLDGNEYTISDLVINRPDSGVGFINFAGSSATIKNVTFSNVDITGTQAGTIANSGALTIENCTVDGQIAGTGTVGGLIGNGNGGTSIINSSADVDITASGSTVGGVIGNGNATTTITGCSTSGTLTGGSYLGGLVGDANANITDCNSSMDITGEKSSSSEIGGLVGSMRSDFSNVSSIKNSHATGTVTGGSYVGGLVGFGALKVDNCYAEGNVTGNQDDSSEIGGLAGQVISSPDGDTKVILSHATGDVTGGSYLGGLVGNAGAPITKSYATGDVTADSGSGSEAGGLVGDANETITESFASGDVSGGSYLGGLVGYGSNSGGNLIVSSYSVGDVTGEDNREGENASEIGALAGSVGSGTVKNSYAVGSVTADEYFNGLIGYNGGSVTNSYWDEVATGVSSDGPGEKLSTADMTGDSASDKMSGLDFTDTWQETVGDGSDSTPTDGYPILQALDASAQRVDAIFLQPPDAPTGLTAVPA